ncbi:MAG TPA: hypothetical protein H9889_05475 [Candidatus Ignatzschineria merdigallinarum]|uniref:DUF5655 domain-containing protein n=1 Tax=Candidatus Ignatzschineria merdigallinarum TaxID=2838621 RepID=A0A9D1Q625_9GAMM|nr:hypothetical protein [Candidatus Ignatzschineria merdigallinarum]
MDIYKISASHLEAIKEQPFQLEKEMQQLFETHLSLLTGLTLVKSEFPLKQFRFDTLAFDHEKQAFVVIEYKRDKNQSVVDQGVSYLNALLEYRDSLIVEYNEQNLGKTLKRSNVDWSQSRILFVANAFTDYQKNATNFKNLGIELIEFKRYKNDLLTVNYIERSRNAPALPSIPTNGDNALLTNITKEIVVYDEETFYQRGSEKTIELYEQFKQAILNLDNELQLVYTKFYAAFKKDKTNIVDIKIQKNALKLWINAPWGTLDEPKTIFRNVSQIGHLGNGDYEIILKNTDQLEYILSVIKQRL